MLKPKPENCEICKKPKKLHYFKHLWLCDDCLRKVKKPMIPLKDMLDKHI